mmetsp:Transcript_32815/g.57227  ORF Transcript_32815/g.57227 Transcript_32815/m.57227 type:complete len:200 (-) Transcript_32815:8562-9161(-)
MSVYGGFSTRQQETLYSDLTFHLLDLMQRRLIETASLKEDPEWGQQFSKVVKSMKQLEQHKYLEPKYTKGVELLYDFVDGRRRRDNLSTSSSLRSEKSTKPSCKSSELKMSTGKPLKNIREELDLSLRSPRRASTRKRHSSKGRKPLNLSQEVLSLSDPTKTRKFASARLIQESPRRKKQTLLFLRPPDLNVWLVDPQP